MLLSNQQKYILDALRKLGCVREDQLHALVRGKFQRPGFAVREEHMTTMLRQLRSGLGDFHVDGGFVYLARGQPDTARLEAIDVMLELSEGAPQEFTVKVDSPRLLCFTLGGDKLKLFSVAMLSHVSDTQLLQRERSERIVWISDSGTPPDGLALPPKRLNERLRVIFARNIRSTLGFCGGMAFHVRSQVSLTHSSESSAQCRMLLAIVKQYAPYLLAVSDMASAFFCQYSSTI